jgi:DNA-binding transcriptional regulator YiaG
MMIMRRIANCGQILKGNLMHSALPDTDIPEYQFYIQRGNGGRVSCVSSTASSVVHVDRSQEHAIPESAELLDSFLDAFIARSDISLHMPSARRELARSYLDKGEPVNLRTLRLNKGWSQSDLASALGTSQAAVSEYESRRRKPAEDMIRNLAGTLEVDFNTLMDALANG